MYGELIVNGNTLTTGSLTGTAVVYSGSTFGSTLVINTTTTQTWAGVIADAGGGDSLSLVKSGTGTEIFTSANGYEGTTTINAGTLQIGAGNTAGSLGTGNVVDDSELEFDLTSNVTVANAISGNGYLVQAGTGTTTLAGADTYTSTTYVDAGTLLVNGPPTAGSFVSVSVGATLGGSGTDTGSIANFGVISPGQSYGSTGAGILSTGFATFFSGSSFDVDLNGTAAGSGYDELSVTGSATLGSGTAALNLAIGPNFSAGIGATFNILVTSVGVTGTFSGLAQGATITADGQVFTISYQGNSGRNVVLTYDGAFTTTALALTTGTNPSTYGTTLTFTATVASNSLPTGSVEFFDGGTALGAGTALSGSGDSATSSFTISNLSAAAHSINAVYTPTGAFDGSSSTNVSQTVTTANLIVTASNQTETYGFGGMSASLGTTAFTSSGLQNGETIASVTLTTSASTSTSSNYNTDAYNGNNPWTITPSAASGGTFTGSNYSITYANATTGLTINTAPLSVTGVSGTNNVYDGLTSDPITGTASLSGKLTNDVVNLSAGTASFANANVGTNKPVTFSGYSISGTDSGDYSLSQPANSSANITPKALIYTGLSVPASKVYDGTTTAVLSGAASLQSAETAGSGSTSDGKPYTGDTVSITGTATETYNTKDVATAATVTFGGLSLTGAQASDYSLTASTQAATITAKALTYSGLSVPTSKVYDGTTTAVVSGTAALQTAEATGSGSTSDSKPYAGDTVSITGTATGTYNSKDKATATTVAFGALSLTGAQASDYSLTASTQTATITVKALTYSGLSVPTSKVYDGTTTAVVSGTAALQTAESAGSGTTADGKSYSGDTVSITGTSAGTYNSKDEAIATTVTFGGLSLTGAQASDYSLTASTQAATITAKALSYSGLSVPSSRVYQGTTTAVVSGTAVLQSAETVGSGTTADGKPYSGDTVSFTGTATGTYNSKDVAAATTVTFGGLSLTGAQASDYSLTASTQAATITAKALTYSGLSVPTSKVYDGTTTAVVSGTASLQATEAAGTGSTSDGKFYTGDTVSITGSATGTYNTKDVATAATVTFGALSLTGAQAADYSLTALTQAATITAKALTNSGLSVPLSKVYDGTTTAVVSGTASLQATEAAGTGSTSDGKSYTGDTVSITGTATGTYNSKDKATATTVTFGGLSLTGAQAGDYSLTASTQAATITAAGLTVSSITATNKVYNANTTATLTTTGAVLVGVFSGDTVTLGTSGASGTFASDSVGNAITVAVAGLTISGAQAGDYSLTQPTTTANITAAPLTITASNESKAYGTTFTPVGTSQFTSSGLFTGDTVTSVTLTSSGDGATATVGTYNIVPSAAIGSGLGDYAIGYVNGTLTVTPVAPTVTTTAATSVSATGAILNASVNANDSTTNVWFQYSTSPLFPLTATTTVASGFSGPHGVAVDAAGDVFVADTNNNLVKEILPNGTINTIGSGFNGPTGVAVDSAGDVFVTDDGNNAVKEVLPNGTIHTIGSGFNDPYGVALDAAGDVFVDDTNNNAVKEVLPNGTINTIGSGFNHPRGVAVDAAGDVFVADDRNSAVTEVLPNGTINTILSGIAQPTGVAVDAAGDVFVDSTSGGFVEEVLANSTVNTIISGLSSPVGVALDAAGDVFVDDTNNNRILEQSPPMVAATPATLTGTTAAAVTAALTGLTQGTTYYDRVVAANSTGTVADPQSPPQSFTTLFTTTTAINAPTVTYGANGVVTVTETSAGGTPTGTVTLSVNGGAAQPQALSGGTATFTLPSPAAGTYALTVNYAGQGIFQASSLNGTLTVNAATLTVSGVTAVNKVYNASTTATLNTTGAALVGVISGDTVTLGTSGATGTFASKNVGTITVTVAGLTISGAQAGDYTLTQPTTTANITAAGLTVSGITATNKIYNANTNATLTTTGAALVGVFSGDTVTLGTSGATGTFASDSVGNGITVAVAGLTLGGAQDGDYTLTQPTTTATITAAGLTVSGITATNKVYNANTTATLTTTSAALVGVFSGDTVTLGTSSASGTFTSKNVGNGITVTVAGLTLGGAQDGDYTLTQPTTTATITAAGLTVSGITATNKVYNANTTATLTTTGAVLVGVFSGDTVTLGTSSASGTFTSKNVENGITVTVAGLTIGGAQAGDYTLTQPTTTANITAAGLTVSGITATNKVYNANTTATLTTTSAALVGVFSGDTVTLGTSGAAGTFTSDSVGNGITVAVAGLTISGAQAGDYTLTQPTTTATITPKALTYSGLSVPTSKVYDGTTTAVVTGTASLQATEAAGTGTASDGKSYAGDTVSITGTATGTYNSKDKATATTVTFGGLSLTGAQAGDYSLTASTQAATITAAGLTVSGITATNKVYNASTTASLNTAGAALVGVFSGDTVTLGTSSASGAFASKNVGNGITVTVAGLTISGAQVSDYTLTQPTTTANITPASLAVTAAGVGKVYDATTNATVTLSDNRINGDVVTDSYTSASFTNKNVANGKSVTVSGISISGTDAGNYTLQNTTATATANITPASLTVTATGVNKVYDATANATVTLSDNRINGDVVTDSYTSASFANKNVANGKSATISGISISGTDAGNYTLQNTTATATANIAPASLTVTATGVNKVYDATNNASTTLSDNRISGDVVTDSYTSASFSGKDVGTGLTVSVSGISISGTDAGDYTLQNTTATTTANITQASLTVTIANDSHVYGTTDSFSTLAPTINTGVNGENLDISYSSVGNTVTAHVGSSSPVTGTLSNGSGLTTDYSVTLTPGALTVTPYTFSYTIANDSHVYGTTDSFSTLAATIATGVNSQNLDIAYSSVGNTVTAHVGSSSPITGMLSNGSGLNGDYSVTLTPGALTVTPANLYVTANANSKTYGATASDTGAISGVLNNDDITASFSSAGDGAAAPVGAGSYAITATLSDPNSALSNYTVHETDSTLTVNKANATISVTPYSVSYDSSAHTASGTVTGVFSENLSAELILSGTTHTSAGTYNGDAWSFHDAAGNYNDASGTVNDAIAQRDLVVTAAANSKTYGQTASDSGTVSGVQGSDDITYSFSSTGDAATAAVGSGSYAITATLSDPNNKIANYAIHETDATLTVTKANATISVLPYSVTYDSTAHTASGTATGVFSEDLSADLILSGTTHTSAGTYNGDAWSYHDAAGNYNDASGTVNDAIAQRDLVVTAAANSKTYGQTASDSGTVSGVQGSDDITYSFSSTGDAATAAVGTGSYAINATLSDPNNKIANYAVHETDATLTVNKANATISVLPYSVTYDSTAHTASSTATGVFSENLSAELILSGTTHTSAGTYNGDTWSYHDAAGNYNDASGTVNDAIAQRDLVVTAAANSKTYGQTASDSGTVSGVQGSDDITYSFSSSGDAATAAVGSGSYAITATLSDPNNKIANYAIHETGATLTVNKANATISVTPYSVSYDSSAHTASGTVTGVFSENLSAELILSGTTHTSAGTYNGDAWSFHDAAGNYNDASGTVNDAIAQRDLVVTAAANSKTYGQTASDSGTVSGVQGSDDITYSFSSSGDAATASVGSGSYVITATLSDPNNKIANYAVHETDATLTVNKANATISVLPYSVTYDSTAHTASGTATGVFSEDLSADLILSGTTHTSAGTYNGDTWSFHDAAGNYNDASGTVNDAIAQRDLVVTAAANSKTYGQTASDSGTVSGVQGSDGITYSFSSSGDAATAAVGSGSYAITATLSDPNNKIANYAIHETGATLTVTKANATISVLPYSVTYDSTAHTASSTATGVFSEDLSADLILSGTTHTSAGTYNGDAWSYHDAAGNYNDASGTVNDAIAQRDLVVTAAANSKTYGQTASDSGTVSGVQGSDDITYSFSSTGDAATAAVGTGSYAINATLSDPNNKIANYAVHETDATLTVNKANATISVLPYSVTYDSTAHTASSTATGVFSENLSAELILSGTTHTSAGTYNGDTWSYHDAAGNYNDASGTVNDAIAQRDLVVTAAANSKTYGQTASDSGTVSGVQGSDDITYSFSSSGDAATASVGSGSYVITATLSDPNNKIANYAVHETDATLTVNKANATISVLPYSVTYDSTAHTASSTATGVFSEDLSADLILSGTTHTSAGTYNGDTWSFHDAAGNYNDASGTVNDAIAQRDLVVTAAANSKTYGQTASDSGTVTGVQGSDAITYSFSSSGDAATAPVGSGSYAITATLSDPNNKIANYAVHETDATLTVNKANATISVTPYSVTYDSTAHTASGTATGVFSEDLSADLSLSGTTHTSAGTYNADAWSFHDAAGNYNDASGSVNDVIAQRDLVVTAAANSKTYGQTASDSGTVTGVQGSDDITYSFSSSGDAATASVGTGSYAITATLSDPNNKVANYAVHETDATLTVNKANAIISVTPYSVTYDSSAYTASGTATGVFSEDLSADLSLSGTTHTSAGTYNADAWSFHDAAGNYNDASGSVNDAIAQRDLVVTAAANSKTYGQTASDSGTVTGVQGSDDITYSFSSSGDAATAPVGSGSYAITATLSDPNNKIANYAVHETDATLTVNKANATISVTPYSVTYDSSAYTASGTATGVFSEDLSADLSLSGTTHTSAGTYNADAWSFHDAAGNYNDASGTVNDAIAQRDLVVTAAANSKTYGQTASDSGTVTGVQGSDAITYSFSSSGDAATAPVGSGSYAITATLSDPNNKIANYAVHETDATLTVNKANATISVTPYSVTYDSTAHTASGTATGVFSEDLSADLSLSGTTHTSAGTYNADVWSFDDPTGNYNDIASTSITDTIGKANATVVVTPYSVTYDSNAHTATYTITGVGSDTSAAGSSVTLNTTHTNAGTYASDTWSFSGGNNYNDIASTPITDIIGKANATVVVTPYSVTYDSNAHTATYTIAGVGSDTAAAGSSVTLNTTHTSAGSYSSDTWSFSGGNNYNDIASTPITDIIGKANATVVVTPYNVTYDSNAHTATYTINGVGSDTAAAGSSLALNTTHTSAGSYSSDTWSFSGGNNYNDIASTPITDIIGKANATVVFTPYSVTYDSNAHSATYTIAGVGSDTAAADTSLTLNTTHTNAGTYSSDSWSFAGGTNYNDIASTPITDVIGKANATVVVTPYSVTYDSNAHTATYTINGVGSDISAAGSSLTLNSMHTSAGSYSGDTWSFSGGNNYNDIASTPITDIIGKANATVVVTPYSVTYDSNAHTATYTITGVGSDTSAAGSSLTLNTTHTSAGTYSSDTWSFSGGNNYNSIASTPITDTIGKANATVVVTPYSVTYDSNAHTATGTASGVGGANLSGDLSLSGTSHTNAGTYNGDSWTFTDPTGNYQSASGTVNDVINKAAATISVTPYSVTYDSNAHTATATATGVGGANLNGDVSVSGTSHTNAGTYNGDSWTFTDPTGNYQSASGTVNDVIIKATATISVTPYSVTYDSNAHSATGTATGVGGANLSGDLSLSGTSHTNAGTYNGDSWTFTDPTGNYQSASGTVTDTINKAAATISVTPYSVTYNAAAHTATGTATGIGGANLTGDLSLSGTTHTSAGTYTTDSWSFNDPTGNYQSASGTFADTINQAAAAISVTPYSVTYNAAPIQPQARPPAWAAST